MAIFSIATTNQATVLSDADVQAALPALQHQTTYDFAPHWHASASLHFLAGSTPTIPASMFHFAVLDDSDQAGALGYHDVDSQYKPEAFIFAKTCQQYNLSWTVCFSHELLELLGDMMANDATQFSNTEFYAKEMCDPVEDDSLGYHITYPAASKPVLVSDFVLPRFFIPGAPAYYDYQHHVTQPGEILKGGYQYVYVSGKGWQSRQNFSGTVEIKDELGETLDRPRPSFEVMVAYKQFLAQESE